METVPAFVDEPGHLRGRSSSLVGPSQLPVLALGLDRLFGFVSRHPEWGNYPTEVTEQNRQRLYRQFRVLMLTARILVAITLNSVAWLTVEIARHRIDRLSPVWVGVCIGAMVIASLLSVWRMRRG